MEAEQEWEKEMKIVLHSPPIYPLPEEIKKVGNDSKIPFQAGPLVIILFEVRAKHQGNQYEKTLC